MTSSARPRLPVALGLVLALALLGFSGAPARASGSWNFASRIAPGSAVAGAEAGDLTLYLRNDDGTVLAGVNDAGSGESPLSDLAAGQALVAWTSPLATGGQEVVGVARSDVAAVSALFADGSTALLPLGSLNAFSNTNGHARLIDLQAVDATGATVGEIAVPPTGPACGQTVCRVLAAAAATAGGASTEPVYGLFSLPARLGSRVVSYGGKMTIGRVDPTTLAPTGKQLGLPGSFWPLAFSPDGSHLLGATNQTGLTIIDLAHLTESPRLQARLVADLASQTVRAAAWPTPNRVLILEQRLSRPYQRDVVSRTLLAIDPRSGKVVWKRPLSHKLGLFGARTVGDRLVLQLGDSSLRRTRETLVIASPTGELRSSIVDLPRIKSRFQEARLVATGGASPAAYLVAANGTVFSIDLDTARATPHRVEAPAGAPTLAPAEYSDIPASAPLGDNIVASGLFTRADGKPRIGIYLIDTHTWTARLVDRSATSYTAGDGRLITFTTAPFFIPSRGGDKGSGTGITIYDEDGVRLHHLYGERKFTTVGITPSLAFAFAPTPPSASHRLPGPLLRTGERLIFDPASGTSLGHMARASIESPRILSPGTPLIDNG